MVPPKIVSDISTAGINHPVSLGPILGQPMLILPLVTSGQGAGQMSMAVVPGEEAGDAVTYLPLGPAADLAGLQPASAGGLYVPRDSGDAERVLRQLTQSSNGSGRGRGQQLGRHFSSRTSFLQMLMAISPQWLVIPVAQLSGVGDIAGLLQEGLPGMRLDLAKLFQQGALQMLDLHGSAAVRGLTGTMTPVVPETVQAEPQPIIRWLDRLIPVDQRSRAVVKDVRPLVEGGRYPRKAVEGDRVPVSATVFADGHDELAARILYRKKPGDASSPWYVSPMQQSLTAYPPAWAGDFLAPELGRYEYMVEAWIDDFSTWRRNLERWRSGGGRVDAVEFQVGARLIDDVLAHPAIAPRDRRRLEELKAMVGEGDINVSLGEELRELMRRYEAPKHPTRSPVYEVVADPKIAEFGAWYELFPRSASPDPARPGTLQDVIDRLPAIKMMGFDVLYLPPIHPIGAINRKGRHGGLTAAPGDPGSPWAIADHKAIHPDLGTLDDFRRLVAEAEKLGIRIAMDLAYQVSPDHPYVREHSSWFKVLPDGTIRYAENPPKKYQDIHPFDFESSDAPELWRELRSIADFWIRQGVRIFRVDNPHTKPMRFWEWMIEGLKAEHPDIVFLSEAFTEPYRMEQLAALGMSQSYTHFAWLQGKPAFEEYMGHLQSMAHFFRPNLWPTTPDILVRPVRHGNAAAFKTRLILAATLSPSYGIYGPSFELGENVPQTDADVADHRDSEKFEVRHWDWERPTELRRLIPRVNRIRRENPALQRFSGLAFHGVSDEHLLAYSRRSADGKNVILVFVNLDHSGTHAGWANMRWEELGLPASGTYIVRDLLSERGAYWEWNAERANYVELSPGQAHIFRVELPMELPEEMQSDHP